MNTGGNMTQIRPTYQPISIFEERILSAMGAAANLTTYMSGDNAIRALIAYEAEMSHAGGGTPDFYTGIEINLKWSMLADLAVGDA
jgi:hypothetical protein